MTTKTEQTAPAQTKPGSQIIVDTLLEQGVEVLFGYLGGVVLPLFDKLYDSPIRVIIPRHEQGGCHMADAYARSTGKVGVMIATSGPGATNLTTGLATAMMDSVPIVALTGQVRTDLIGNDAFQEADTTGITRPITKHNVIIKNPNDLAHTIREAFYIASTGRPGPVLIDIPVDMQVAQVPVTPPQPIELPGYRVREHGHARQISSAAEAINASQRPVLYVGGGVISGNASEPLRKLAKKANIPVTMTLMGLGAFDQNDPLSLDMLGMHGAAYANFAVQESDLLICVGARFDDRVTGKLKTFASHARIIHIDLDPSSIAKNVPVDIPVVGNARYVLADLLEQVEYRERKEWFERIAELKKRYPLRYDRNSKMIKPQYVIEELWHQTQGQAIITTGVGQHQMWTAQFYKFSRPRQFITSGGLGTMGFGLPAAIGAQIGNPGALVVDIDGDSSFNMTLTELSTAVMYELPIKICLINNGYMGMVRQWQELFYGRRYSCSSLKNPDFARLAEAFGAVGLSARKKEEVPAVIKAMLEEKKPCLADFYVDPEENVWPMVPTGKSLHEMDGLNLLEMA
ncbi:MAG TPA: biosynthetic-type acetolactate synthase large subunit [Anaerohalosphaeraceae bacterium]|nr:biosynthetic-type acetolactate synthase large subunit [Anaerohalosphaeraceae bacterium]HQG05983.1 biosynthetic-type acetolactate synthase large subunit [Anaerohalosphaeraceae bacterium]HQI07265.1 biosynthetic-type acetolactate synthase large subunit [Anaerohalosphaeraceae bacterium]HQJ67290.1 biosynthetic-type acetolactate synthase large subunit [Anaerohalosphaeraceae bacterium]